MKRASPNPLKNAKFDHLQAPLADFKHIHSMNQIYKTKHFKESLQQQTLPFLSQHSSEEVYQNAYQSVYSTPQKHGFLERRRQTMSQRRTFGLNPQQVEASNERKELQPLHSEMIVKALVRSPDGLKVKMEHIPNIVQINKRMFQIKKNQKKVPIIDFSLRLDAYHSNDNCLHCQRGVLNNHIF
mmetsp:Transcript_5071/g.4634  ORF Transcript_5071/g.4634 Transcript_5071/m.4634 type:complete len:184 (+) Transcript_5071:238-789(+)